MKGTSRRWSLISGLLSVGVFVFSILSIGSNEGQTVPDTTVIPILVSMFTGTVSLFVFLASYPSPKKEDVLR